MPKAAAVTLAALSGVAVCLLAVTRFFMTIINNRIPWSPDGTARELYLLVGNSYTQGFVVGFFLCFSLAVAAIAISAARQARLAAGEGDEAVEVEGAEPLRPRIVRSAR